MGVPGNTASVESNIWFLGMAGLVVGLGIVGLLFARLGNWAFGKKKDNAQDESTILPCPYANDHPVVHDFMDESRADRRKMWEFLGTIRDTQMEMRGQLGMLVKGARIRWNQGLIPPDREEK